MGQGRGGTIFWSRGQTNCRLLGKKSVSYGANKKMVKKNLVVTPHFPTTATVNVLLGIMYIIKDLSGPFLSLTHANYTLQHYFSDWSSHFWSPNSVGVIVPHNQGRWLITFLAITTFCFFSFFCHQHQYHLADTIKTFRKMSQSFLFSKHSWHCMEFSMQKHLLPNLLTFTNATKILLDTSSF